GGDHADQRRRVAQRSHDEEVDEGADDGGEGDAGDEAGQEGPALVRGQLPPDVGAGHPDRAQAEVQYPGTPVDDDQARGGERVGGADAQPQERETDYFFHVCSLSLLRAGPGPGREARGRSAASLVAIRCRRAARSPSVWYRRPVPTRLRIRCWLGPACLP